MSFLLAGGRLEHRLALGDEWLAVSRRLSNPADQRACLYRAGFWYEAARKKSSGLERIDIENKIAAMWRDERGRVVDPSRDAVRGEWCLIGGVLCNRARRSEWAVLDLPMRMPSEYDLELVVELRSDASTEFGFGVVMGERQAHVNLSDPCGFGLIDGKKSNENETKVGRTVLRPGESVTIRAEVRESTVTVKLGNKMLFTWKGAAGRLTLSKGLRTPHQDAMFVRGTADIMIHELSVRPIEGDGRPLCSRVDAAGTALKVTRSTDSGATWFTNASPVGGGLTTISAPSPQVAQNKRWPRRHPGRYRGYDGANCPGSACQTRAPKTGLSGLRDPRGSYSR